MCVYVCMCVYAVRASMYVYVCICECASVGVLQEVFMRDGHVTCACVYVAWVSVSARRSLCSKMITLRGCRY